MKDMSIVKQKWHLFLCSNNELQINIAFSARKLQHNKPRQI